MPLVKVSHIGINCIGRGGNNKKPLDIGIFRVYDEEGSFEVLCPWCRNPVTIRNYALVCPSKYPELEGLRYRDVSQQFRGK
jgi:hypothetical protein